MSDTNDAASRTEEPTPRKLEQAREKGDVVKTLDLGSFATLAAAASVVIFGGGWMSRNLAGASDAQQRGGNVEACVCGGSGKVRFGVCGGGARPAYCDCTDYRGARREVGCGSYCIRG